MLIHHLHRACVDCEAWRNRPERRDTAGAGRPLVWGTYYIEPLGYRTFELLSSRVYRYWWNEVDSACPPAFCFSDYTSVRPRIYVARAPSQSGMVP